MCPRLCVRLVPLLFYAGYYLGLSGVRVGMGTAVVRDSMGTGKSSDTAVPGMIYFVYILYFISA